MGVKKTVNIKLENDWVLETTETDYASLYLMLRKKVHGGGNMQLDDKNVQEIIDILKNGSKWEKYKELKKELK